MGGGFPFAMASFLFADAEISEVTGSLKIFVKRLSGFGENRHL
jgi:hypothetical protein